MPKPAQFGRKAAASLLRGCKACVHPAVRRTGCDPSSPSMFNRLSTVFTVERRDGAAQGQRSECHGEGAAAFGRPGAMWGSLCRRPRTPRASSPARRGARLPPSWALARARSRTGSRDSSRPAREGVGDGDRQPLTRGPQGDGERSAHVRRERVFDGRRGRGALCACPITALPVCTWGLHVRAPRAREQRAEPPGTLRGSRGLGAGGRPAPIDERVLC